MKLLSTLVLVAVLSVGTVYSQKNKVEEKKKVEEVHPIYLTNGLKTEPKKKKSVKNLKENTLNNSLETYLSKVSNSQLKSKSSSQKAFKSTTDTKTIFDGIVAVGIDTPPNDTQLYVQSNDLKVGIVSQTDHTIDYQFGVLSAVNRANTKDGYDFLQQILFIHEFNHGFNFFVI